MRRNAFAARLARVVAIAGFRVGEVELARVPYFDVPLDPSVVSLTTDQVTSIDWATPSWATDDGKVLIGQAVWVIVSQGQLIVVDPCGAADQFLRSGPEAIGHQEAVLGAMRDAGFPPERVDIVVLSHLDGIGMAAVVEPDGSWAPAFPNARIVMTAAELEFLSGAAPVALRADGLDALNALIAGGVVDGVDDGHRLTDEVSLELTGAHTPGHALVRVHSDGETATFLGHLALSPLHIASGVHSALHRDVVSVAPVLDKLIAEATADKSLLIGPLWPFPGAGYAEGDRISAASD
jgi:glyoxylase-like metal-dependent hydrolase (beta-lactamase superfamily II)